MNYLLFLICFNKNIDETNENSIKQIYISNLKRDIESKLKEKGYKTKQIKLEVANDDTYQIKSINLSLDRIKEKEESSKSTIVNQIEIEKVEIQIGENTQKENIESNQKVQIAEKEKKEIKQYIANIYEVNENLISIE